MHTKFVLGILWSLGCLNSKGSFHEGFQNFNYQVLSKSKMQYINYMHFTTFLMHNVVLWKYSRNLSSSTYSSHSLRSLKKYHLFSPSQVSSLKRNTNLSQQMFRPLHENRHISNHTYPTHHLNASFESGPSLYYRKR